MSLTHSPATHKSLIARIPFVTGRELSEWFGHLESGPAFLRRDERANWLADEHGICDRYASGDRPRVRNTPPPQALRRLAGYGGRPQEDILLSACIESAPHFSFASALASADAQSSGPLAPDL